MKLSTVVAIILMSIFSHAQNDSTLYSFFVAGHTYGEPGHNNEGFHPPFKQKFPYILNRPEIKFGVLTGDIVSKNPTAQDWDEVDADIDTLGLPVYFAVGNHDMEDRPLFESRYGITYYYFKYQNDLFIVLDPNIDEWNISGEQLDFLKNTVEDNYLSSENIFVFFHQILWKEPGNVFSFILWNSGEGRGETVNFWTEVEPLFRNLPNEVVMFAGDLGASWASDVSYDYYDNITLISSGMGDEDGENFIVVNIDSTKQINYDLICLSDASMNCLGLLTDHLVVSELQNTEPGINIASNTHIYPNPASSTITISQEAPQNINIQLYDIQGMLLFEEEIRGILEHTIDISNLPKGLYLIKAYSSKHLFTTKLVKE